MMRMVNLWKQLNWDAQEDKSCRWSNRHEAVGEKEGVDSREQVRHSKKTDQLFIDMTMKVGWITDEEQVLH